jgi:hypothetical protein
MKKVKMSIKDLPILGYAQIPIRLMHYEHKKDKTKFFQSGFAFFGIADDQADVTGPNGENRGSLGGKMGGNYEIIQRREKDDINVIIDVEDFWDQLTNLLETEGAKVQLVGIEEIYKKYWAKHEKLKEIAQMQEDAEEAVKKEEEEKAKVETKKLEAKAKKIDEWVILDDKGWDLNKEIPDYDYHFEEDYRFPVDLGLGVRITKKGEYYTSRREGNPTVILDITSWKGTGAIGAIHYYGTLKIKLPDFTRDDRHTYGTSTWEIPLFKNESINLTHVLEEWEIKRYPDNYQDNRPGQHIRGFYTPEGAKRAAEVFFCEHFDPGWDFKVEENY